VVELQVGNHITARFLVLTNYNASCISPEFAAQLKLKPVSITQAGNSYQVATLPRLEFGSPNLNSVNVPMIVTDLSAIAKRGDKAVDGILGANIIAAIAVGIDYERGTITFWDHGNITDAELRSAGFANTITAELKRAASGNYQYFVPVILTNGGRTKAIDLLLNTSLPYNVLPNSAAKDLGLSPSHPWDVPELNAATIDSMKFGDAVTSSSLFVVSNEEPSLGLETLYQYRVIIDAAARKLYLSPCVSVAPAPQNATGLAVPFEFGASTQHKIIVRASVNGSSPKPFVLDTGTSGPLLLDRETVRAMGVAASSGKNTISMNGVLPLDMAQVSSLVLQGRTPADNVAVSLDQARVADLKALKHLAGASLAGIIGAGILRNTAVRLDFKSRIATFYPAPLAAPMPSKAASIPFLPTLRPDSYFVGIDFGRNKPATMIIDTGEDGVTIPISAIPTEKSISGTPCISWIGGVLMLGETLTIPQMHLGIVTGGNATVTVLPLDRIPMRIPGTLGMEVLSQVEVTLDIPHNRLLLAPPSSSPVNDYPTGWTGILLAESDRGVVQITGSEPASPAFKAGIKAGEQLVAVDGQSIASIGYNAAVNLLGGHANTPVIIKVRGANGTLRTVRIRRQKIPSYLQSTFTGLFAYQYGNRPMMVDSVTPGSVPARAGIRPGDAITAIDGHPMASIAAGHFFDLYQAHVDMTIRKQNKGQLIVVHLVTPAKKP